MYSSWLDTRQIRLIRNLARKKVQSGKRIFTVQKIFKRYHIIEYRLCSDGEMVRIGRVNYIYSKHKEVITGQAKLCAQQSGSVFIEGITAKSTIAQITAGILRGAQ